MTDHASLQRAMRVQTRVLGALLLREIITRYGRHNIGFLWLFLEPIMFCLGVVILWNNTHRSSGLQVEITPFVVTGYSCLLLWRTCSFRGLMAIEPNRSLLHHRQVKIQDIFAARMLLEITGVTAALLILLTLMNALGFMELPRDPMLMMGGWLSMAWFSACLGIILGCLSELSDLVERIWHPSSYFLLAISGTFFMGDWLPTSTQELATWVPMVNAVEMMRAGYWGDSPHFHYQIAYLVFVCLSMTLASLLLMRMPALRRMH
jgi:capsular polysaccharide transport system permease protein